MATVTGLIDAELSEPYSLFTYRYFLLSWPELCWIARDVETGEALGVIVGKIEDGSEAAAAAGGAVPLGAGSETAPSDNVDGQGAEGAATPAAAPPKEGYIAMLVVVGAARRKGVGRELVARSVAAMRAGGCEAVCLEAERSNAAALRLYESMGFLREYRLFQYYLNGSDAFRLVLALPPPKDKGPLDALANAAAVKA